MCCPHHPCSSRTTTLGPHTLVDGHPGMPPWLLGSPLVLFWASQVSGWPPQDHCWNFGGYPFPTFRPYISRMATPESHPPFSIPKPGFSDIGAQGGFLGLLAAPPSVGLHPKIPHDLYLPSFKDKETSRRQWQRHQQFHGRGAYLSKARSWSDTPVCSRWPAGFGSRLRSWRGGEVANYRGNWHVTRETSRRAPAPHHLFNEESRWSSDLKLEQSPAEAGGNNVGGSVMWGRYGWSRCWSGRGCTESKRTVTQGGLTIQQAMWLQGGQWGEWPRIWGVGGWRGLHHTGPQSSFNFKAAVTIHSNFGAQENICGFYEKKRGYKWTYLQKRNRLTDRKQVYGSQRGSGGRDKLVVWC